MTDFEVTIVSPEAKSVSITLSVKADNWVQAWHEGLSIMGDGGAPPGASCVLGDDRAIHIHVPDSERTFIIRQVVEGEPVTARGPRVRRGVPTPVGELVRALAPPTASAVPPAALSSERAPEATVPARPKPTRRPLRRDPRIPQSPTRPPERQRPPPALAETPPEQPRVQARDAASNEPTEPALLPPRFDDDAANIPAVVDGAPVPTELRRTVDDPVVRVLNELEQARLKARPLRISSETGLPKRSELPDTGRRRRAEQTFIGRPASKSGARPRPDPTRGETAAFGALRASDPLPQQFRAIDPGAADLQAPEDLLRHAIDTAWQFIPCRVAQALRYRGRMALDVVAARGERAREFASCRIHAARTFSQLTSGHPARIKFSGDPARVRFQTPDGGVYDEPVRSALCVPLFDGDGAPYAVLMLLDATRKGGSFADGELRALSYLAKTVERALTPLVG